MLETFVSTVKWPSAYTNDSTGGGTRLIWSFFVAAASLAVDLPNAFAGLTVVSGPAVLQC